MGFYGEYSNGQYWCEEYEHLKDIPNLFIEKYGLLDRIREEEEFNENDELN